MGVGGGGVEGGWLVGVWRRVGGRWWSLDGGWLEVDRWWVVGVGVVGGLRWEVSGWWDCLLLNVQAAC